MKIKGLKELENTLKKMEKKTAKKAVRKGVRTAQKICLKAAKSNVQNMVGGEMGRKIAAALKVKAVRKQKKGSYALQVAIDPNKAEQFKHKTEDGKTYYVPTAIEYGHRKVGGGKVSAIPYMRNAADKTEKARMKTLIKIIKKELSSA